MLFALTREQRDIVRAARKFAQGEFPDRALEFDREETFDFDLWKRACELGFVGVFIDQAYGGAGMGFMEHCLITEEFWAADPGIGQAMKSFLKRLAGGRRSFRDLGMGETAALSLSKGMLSPASP